LRQRPIEKSVFTAGLKICPIPFTATAAAKNWIDFISTIQEVKKQKVPAPLSLRDG
jgi:hypothetical protein